MFTSTLDMATLNPALFEPLKRLEDVARRAGGVLLTAPDVSPTKDEMIAKGIQTNARRSPGIEAGEAAGFQDGAIRPHGGT